MTVNATRPNHWLFRTGILEHARNTSICLSDLQLEQLVQGLLEETLLDSAQMHLEQCENCIGRLRNVVTDDPLAAAMRDHEKVRDRLASLSAPIRRLVERVNDRETSASRIDNTHVTDPSASRQRSSKTTLEPGTVLGNYVVEDVLGQGGMGVVYKARHRRMDRVVALKILPREFAVDALAVSRFRREVKALAQLNHPHVVSAYDADESDGVFFLAMELIEGVDLQTLVRKSGPLSIERAVDYVVQAAEGLAYAHEKGMVHRDVKPANLLLDHDTTVKILDLGLARLDPSNDVSHSFSTEVGTVMGTVDFMAPEQALDSRTADSRSDIYSLGCTLFWLLTGKPLFEGDTVMKKLISHREQAPTPLRAIRKDVPPILESVVLRMLAKKPEDRFATMRDVITAVEPFASRANSSTSPAKRRRSLWTIAAAAALILLVLAGIVFKFKTASGTLVVTVDPADADIEILSADGQIEFSRPGEEGGIHLSVDHGRHQLRVQKNGFELFTREFTTNWGNETSINAKLVPLKAIADKPVTDDPGSPKDEHRSSVPTNYALLFDGKESYVDFPSLKYRGETDLTIECRVTPLTLAFSSIFGNNEQGGVNVGVVADQAWHQLTNCFVFVVGQQQEGGDPYAILGSTIAPKINESIHLAAVYDRKTLKLFVNGKLKGTTQVKLPHKESALPFWIGADPCPEATRTSPLYRPFHGVIDDLRVSSIARYSADFEPPTDYEKDAATELLCNFNEGPGLKVYDHSGHHRFGFVHNVEFLDVETEATRFAAELAARRPRDEADATHNLESAKWVLAVEGQLKVWLDDKEIEIKTEADLPSTPFVMSSVRLMAHKDLTDASLDHLDHLHGLKSLTFYDAGITDTGLKRIQGLSTLTELAVQTGSHREAVTDEGLGTLLSQTPQLVTPDLRYSSGIRGVCVGRLPNPERLKNLAGYDVSYDTTGLSAISQLPNLERLTSVGGPRVLAHGWRALGGLTKLKTLEAQHYVADDDSIETLLRIPQLEHLVLSRTSRIGDKGLRGLATLKKLQHLQIGASTASDEGIAQLAQLTDLYQAEFGLVPQATDAALKALVQAPKLKWLTLDSPRITNAGLQHIAGRISLRLQLGYARIDDAGLAQIIAGSPNLSYLGLNDTDVTGAGLVPLKNMPNLRELNFTGSRLSDSDVEPLKALKLSTLRIQHTPLSQTAAESLKTLMNAGEFYWSPDHAVRRASIWVLRHEGKVVVQRGDKALTCRHVADWEELVQPDLNNLVLHQVDLTDSPFVTDATLKNLEKMTSLTVLKLAGTKLTDISLETLKLFQGLQQLDLRRTSITATGLAEFQKARPDCKVTTSLP